jgi:hypothetical protein
VAKPTVEGELLWNFVSIVWENNIKEKPGVSGISA